MAKGFTKSANQKVSGIKIKRDAPAKKVMEGKDLRSGKRMK